jgi:hypothetical protein
MNNNNNNTGYKGNAKLRGANTVYNYTPEELAEMLKCADDIEYFASNYCTIVTLDKGEQLIELYEYQKEMLQIMHKGKPEENKYNTIVLSPRQSGKCLIGNSKINIKRNNEIKQTTIKEFFDEIKI